MKFYPYEKGGGAEKVLAMHAEGGGGHKKFWGSFDTVACSFSHIEEGGGGAKCFHSLKGGAKSFTLP